MRLKNNKRAFSLTELLIVMVVIAVLFAALAPILGTRRNGASVSTENIWNYVNDDEQQRDIYYDSGVAKWSSTAYIGLTPTILTSVSPRSKVVINASEKLRFNNKPQRQIQFRYGDGDGVNAGSLFMNNTNVSLGSNNDSLVESKNNTENTVAGLGAMSTMGKLPTHALPPAVSGNVAYGSNALKYLYYSRDRNTVVGAGALAGSNPTTARENIFIGSSVANYDHSGGESDISVGSSSMFSGSWGVANIYLGYLVGASDPNTSFNSNNIIAGSQYYAGATDAKFYKNTIIGYDALTGGPRSMYNNTAVGYQACNSMQLQSNGGSRTCIGYRSGASRGITGKETPTTVETSSYDYTYLGGIPLGGFNGRSVLEVYNQKSSGIKGDHKPAVSPTVVLNSNIVIRGAMFIARPNNGALSPFDQKVITRPIDTSRRKGDKCLRKYRFFGPKDWRFPAYYYISHVEFPADAYSNSYMNFMPSCLIDSLSSYVFDKTCPNVKTSDRRLKDVISENNDGLAHIEALMPYNFTFKNDKDSKAQVGVMAQDLQKVYPSSVISGKDGYLRIRWDEMFYSMINSIKIIDKKLIKIADSLSEIESDVLQVKSEQKNIKKQIAILNARASKLERK